MKKLLLYVMVFAFTILGGNLLLDAKNGSLILDEEYELGDVVEVESFDTEEQLVLVDNLQSFEHHIVFTFVGDSYYEENYYTYESEEEFLANLDLYQGKITESDLDSLFIRTRENAVLGTKADVLKLYEYEIENEFFTIID